MSAPESIVQAQTEALLRRVAREQESLCRKAVDAAQEQARGIVSRALEEARARTRLALEEARSAVSQAVTDRRAALETAARRREQSVLRGLMDRGWEQLPGILESAWRDAAIRARWCEAACTVARRTLLGDDGYTVEVDAAATPDVAASIEHGLGGSSAGLTLRARAGLGAGLRVVHGLASVDATVPGLLAARERVEAELLAELGTLLEAHGRRAG
jgi:hypothetical protein